MCKSDINFWKDTLLIIQNFCFFGYFLSEIFCRKEVSTSHHQVLAKRGTLVDVSAIKSSAVNQAVSRKQSGSLNEIKDEAEEKASINQHAESVLCLQLNFFECSL